MNAPRLPPTENQRHNFEVFRLIWSIGELDPMESSAANAHLDYSSFLNAIYPIIMLYIGILQSLMDQLQLIEFLLVSESNVSVLSVKSAHETSWKIAIIWRHLSSLGSGWQGVGGPTNAEVFGFWHGPSAGEQSIYQERFCVQVQNLAGVYSAVPGTAVY